VATMLLEPMNPFKKSKIRASTRRTIRKKGIWLLVFSSEVGAEFTKKGGELRGSPQGTAFSMLQSAGLVKV
jgi:hypothetical protein